MAFSSTTEWEVRKTGSDNNGGGFDPSATGTDFSQQDSAQISYTDLVIDGTTNTKVTSAANPFGGTSPGNIINVTGGAGFTVQRVQVVSVAGVTATCDKSLGTLGSTGGTGNLGGALGSPGKATGLIAASNKVWIKYNASTYDISTSSSNVSNGVINIASSLNCVIQGYDVTHGDYTANRPTLKATTNSITLITLQFSGGTQVRNLVLSAGAATTINGINIADQNYAYKVKVSGANGTYGFRVGDGNFSAATLCEATACTVDPFQIQGGTCYGCVSDANTTGGVFFSGGFSGGTAIKCISSNNTGGSSTGFVNNGATSSMLCINCTAHGNGGSGYGNSGKTQACFLINCIGYGNTGTGINTGSLSNTINCAANSFGSGIIQVGSVTLTADPFTNSAGKDYSLNNVAGGGSACQMAGILGAFPLISTTSHDDIGAVQPTGGTGTVFVINSMNSVFTVARGAIGY